jgi:hypothetical protein
VDIQKMVDDYANWLKSEIVISKYNEYYELTTPYLDRFNDYLQIYVKQDENGKITMTDDGYIIGNLLSSGISFKSGSKRKFMLDKIIRNYSLHLDRTAITTVADAQNFPQRKHLMVQAMLAIDDMFETRPENIKDFFIEDIQAFFDSNEIYYTRDFSLIGKTGSLYNYEFHFQRAKYKSERFCKAINRVRESNRNSTIFNWIDTQEKRNNEGQLIVMLNDENVVNDTDITAFKQYNIESVLFSRKQESIELFRAS